VNASAPITDTNGASTLPRPTTALVRRLPDCFAAAYREQGIAIDLGLAREQHRRYQDALRATGLEVIALPADETRYDCVFIEDTAVVAGGRALIGFPGPHRRGEERAVAEMLGRSMTISHLPPDATLEGGDVLHVESTKYVGLSGRTNTAGAAALESFLAPLGRRLATVPVERCLHLKTGATYLGDGALLAAADSIDARAFDVAEVLFTDPAEPQAANCLRIGETLLVPAGCPRTEVRLRAFADARGVSIVPLDISQFERAGGSLTCLSILW
jgi:dimethylargininase